MKRCRIYRLTAAELAALVARGLGAGVVALGGETVGAGGLPIGLDVPLGAGVVCVHRYPNGNYAIKVQHPHWPAVPEGSPYEVARDVPGGAGTEVL